MMKINSSSYFLIAILLVAIVFLVSAYSMETMRMKLVPLVVSGFIFILSAVELAKELAKSNRIKISSRQKIPASQKEKTAELKKYTIGFLWLAGIFLGILFVGFVPGICIFLFVFLKMHKISWLESTMMSVIYTLVIYGVFVKLLNSDLFPGIFFGGHW